MTLTLKGVIGSVIALINHSIPVLIALALVIFMYGCVRYIMAAGGKAEGGASRSAIAWGLVALFVLFSVWGILGIMCATLLGSGSCR